MDTFVQNDHISYIALAYAIDGKVFAHKEWKSSKYEVGVKPKTIVLLDENEEVIAFGQDAKHMFSNYPI